MTLNHSCATRPYPSWLLDEESCLWVAPVPRPKDGKVYVWDETGLTWTVYN